jgi:iron complex outermembrane recepter protein
LIFNFPGNPSLTSEIVHAYELGYRYQFRDTVSFDAAAFYNHYDGLIDVGAPGASIIFPNYIELPLPEMNSGIGQTHGLELFGKIKPISRWSLSAGITEIRGTATAGTQEVFTPHHILNIQSRLNLVRHLNWDASYFYNDAELELGLPTLNRVDIGVSTRQIGGLTFSLWGRNLQSAQHFENNSSAPYFPAGEIRRAVVLKLMWQSTN